MSTYDRLTGLLTPQSARDHLARWIDSKASFCLALLDLDHFKALNDTHGHAVGDRVLTHVAACIREQLAEDDLAARYGGEEFLLLLASDDLESAEATLASLRETLRTPVPGTDVRVSFSAGVGRRQDADDLVRAVDEALFGAKKAGRDRTLRASR